jgi:hypothetical protein
MNTKQAIFFILYLIFFGLFTVSCKMTFKKNLRIQRCLKIPIKIVNLGLSRTATSSFSVAMHRLGFQTWHFTKTRPRIMHKKYAYNCVSDLPYYRTEFSSQDIEPNTLYFLTIRKPQDWIKSMELFLSSTWNLNLHKPFSFRPFKMPSFNLKSSPFPTNYVDYAIHDIRREYLNMFIDQDPSYFIVNHMQHLLTIFKQAQIPLHIVDLTIGSDKCKWKQLLTVLEPFKSRLNLPHTHEPFPHKSQEYVYKKQVREMI